MLFQQPWKTFRDFKEVTDSFKAEFSELSLQAGREKGLFRMKMALGLCVKQYQNQNAEPSKQARTYLSKVNF